MNNDMRRLEELVADEVNAKLVGRLLLNAEAVNVGTSAACVRLLFAEGMIADIELGYDFTLTIRERE